MWKNFSMYGKMSCPIIVAAPVGNFRGVIQCGKDNQSKKNPDRNRKT